MNKQIGRVVIWLEPAMLIARAGYTLACELFNCGWNARLELRRYRFATTFLVSAGYVLLPDDQARIVIAFPDLGNEMVRCGDVMLAATTRIWIQCRLVPQHPASTACCYRTDASAKHPEDYPLSTFMQPLRSSFKHRCQCIDGCCLAICAGSGRLA